MTYVKFVRDTSKFDYVLVCDGEIVSLHKTFMQAIISMQFSRVKRFKIFALNKAAFDHQEFEPRGVNDNVRYSRFVDSKELTNMFLSENNMPTIE